MNEYNVKSYDAIISSATEINNQFQKMTTEIESVETEMKTLLSDDVFAGEIKDSCEMVWDNIREVLNDYASNMPNFANYLNEAINKYQKADINVSNNVTGGMM